MMPVSPLIRVRVAQILQRRYGLDSGEAVRVASELIDLLRKANLDIVLATWIDDVGKEVTGTDFWGGVRRLMEDEEDGWTPWKPPN